jgi:hypothetical protein
VEAPIRVRRKDHRERCSTSMQQVGHAMMNAPTAAAEDASLATSRWCRSRDCRRRTTAGCPCCCCQNCCSCLSPSSCPYPCLCRCYWGWGQEGEGPLQDMAVPAAVGAEAAATVEDALLLRARNRMRRPVHRPSSCPA